jgi:hypothetical protein
LLAHQRGEGVWLTLRPERYLEQDRSLLCLGQLTCLLMGFVNTQTKVQATSEFIKPVEAHKRHP